MSEPTVDPRATTPTYAWRVPVLGDVPNVPSDITNLALDIENTLKAARAGAWGLAKPTADFAALPVGWSRLSCNTIQQPAGSTDFSTNNGGLATALAGRYLLTCSLFASGASGGTVILAYSVNDTASPPVNQRVWSSPSVGAGEFQAHGHASLLLTAASVVYLHAYYATAGWTVFNVRTHIQLERTADK